MNLTLRVWNIIGVTTYKSAPLVPKCKMWISFGKDESQGLTPSSQHTINLHLLGIYAQGDKGTSEASILVRKKQTEIWHKYNSRPKCEKVSKDVTGSTGKSSCMGGISKVLIKKAATEVVSEQKYFYRKRERLVRREAASGRRRNRQGIRSYPIWPEHKMQRTQDMRLEKQVGWYKLLECHNVSLYATSEDLQARNGSD